MSVLGSIMCTPIVASVISHVIELDPVFQNALATSLSIAMGLSIFLGTTFLAEAVCGCKEQRDELRAAVMFGSRESNPRILGTVFRLRQISLGDAYSVADFLAKHSSSLAADKVTFEALSSDKGIKDKEWAFEQLRCSLALEGIAIFEMEHSSLFSWEKIVMTDYGLEALRALKMDELVNQGGPK